MLTPRRDILSTALVCLVLTAAGSAAASDSATKLQRAKLADFDGYAPQRLARIALVNEIEPNDTIDDAQAIAVGDQVDASIPSGDVDWFLVDAGADAFVTISTMGLDGSRTDTVLDVYSADGTTWVSGDDDGGRGLFSAVRSVDGNGMLAVRVTRFSSVGDDDYQLVVESADAPAAPPANDMPMAADVLADCNAVVSGTTVGATSAVGVAGCLSPDPLGGEVFYRIEVPYSYQLTIHVDAVGAFDPALLLFTDAADPAGSCINAIDEAYAGERETLLFTNEDANSDPLVVYLAVDSWDPQRPGDFDAIVSCDFVVSDDEVTFGALKARF